MRRLRPATVARLGLGLGCVLRPEGVLAAIGGRDRHDSTTQAVTRVLGARLLLQAAVDVLAGRRTRPLDALVDLTHAASMLPVAAVWPDHRRTALVSAAVAGATGSVDLWPGS